MSYVLANTSNPLGRRGLGWENLPHPVYPISRTVARLNGLGEQHDGAITYRIDPRTGQYQFYRTDIKPRGVFMQNTFQHPAPPVMSALGVSLLNGRSVTGSTLQRGRGLGCYGCNGRCNSCMSGPRFPRRRNRWLGAADFPGSCGPQSDGTIIPCGPDPSMATEQGDVPLPGVTPVSVGPQPGQVTTSFEPANPSLPGVTFGPNGIAFSVNPTVRTVSQKSASWFSQSSNIGGTNVPNAMLAFGGVLFAALGLEGSKGRRR